MSAYAYSSDDPINLSDPLGLYGLGVLWQQIKTFWNTLWTTVATKESPIPLPISSKEDIKNTYAAGWEEAKKCVEKHTAVDLDANRNVTPDVWEVINKLNEIDSMKGDEGVKVRNVVELEKSDTFKRVFQRQCRRDLQHGL